MTSNDKTAPKLVSASPQKGGLAIAVNQDVVLTFNENIQVGTGNIIISSGVDTITVPVNSSLVTVNGGVLTVNPAKDLLPISHYTVKIDSTAVLDTSANKYAGIKNTTTLYFDTVDILAPSLVKSSPLASAPTVATNSNIVLTLSEKIQAGTGNITLISGNDSRTFAITDKQVKISGSTLTINPSVDFNIASPFQVHLDAGAIKDLAPVSNLVQAIELSFATKTNSDKQAQTKAAQTFSFPNNSYLASTHNLSVIDVSLILRKFSISHRIIDLNRAKNIPFKTHLSSKSIIRSFGIMPNCS
jgi:methionine-rich copper-binding protein CopC